MNIWTLQCGSVARLSGGAGLPRAGRRRWGARPQELVYRTMRPLVRTVRPPAPRIIQNTVHQTVVHLHQTTHQHILNRLSAAKDGRDAVLLMKQTAMQPAPDSAIDDSRPALTARRLLRIFAAESARQTLKPFYQKIFRELLIQEREEYRGKPERALLLVQGVLGRSRTWTTLRRLYRQTVEQLDGAVVRHAVFRRYVRHIRQEEDGGIFLRYAARERAVPEDLRSLPPAGRAAPPPQPPGREAGHPPEEKRADTRQGPAAGLCLSSAEFRLLVRGVADALGRQSRLESLRRGGM